MVCVHYIFVHCPPFTAIEPPFGQFCGKTHSVDLNSNILGSFNTSVLFAVIKAQKELIQVRGSGETSTWGGGVGEEESGAVFFDYNLPSFVSP